MNSQPVSVSVTVPLSQALDHVKHVLFQPFDLGKWFVIGFCAWLAFLGEGGGGFHGNFSMGIGMLILLVVIVTCCCAACLMAIPYLGTVVLLPVRVFQRSYALFYLAQYGPQYNLFTAGAPSKPSV